MVASAAFLQAGCAGNNVVVEPIAPKTLHPRLMRDVPLAACELQTRPDYAADEIDASRVCWRAGYFKERGLRQGLQRAIRVREQTTAKAVKASKGS